MSKYIIILTISLLLSLYAPVSDASTDFNITDSNLIYGQASCGLANTQPYDPKIACESDGDSCVAVFYDNSFFCISGVKYSVSFDGFQTIAYSNYIENFLYSDSVYLNPATSKGSELPYDIVWDENHQMYWIALMGSSSKVYVIPSYDPIVFGVQPYRVTDGFTGDDGNFYGTDISLDCATLTSYGGGGFYCNPIYISDHPVRFSNDDPTKLFVVSACQMKKDVPLDYRAGLWAVEYDVNDTSYSCTLIDEDTSCLSGSFNWDNFNAYAEYSGTAWKYSIEGQIDYCAADLNRAIDEDTLNSPNDDFNHFYFGGNLFYRNETTFIDYTSQSDDLVTFNTPELLYTEDTSITEIINQSDADDTDTSNYYIFLRTSNLTDNSNGIYVTEQTAYPIVVSSNKDVYISLDCDSEDYSDSGSGKIFQLNTPCITGNVLNIISSYSPQNKIQNIDFPDGCYALGLNIHYADNPFDYELTVKDALTNNFMEDVNVTLTGSSMQTTDSNGKSIFNIQAITGPGFKSYTVGCSIDLSTTGSPKTIYGTATKTGYVDKEFSFNPVTLNYGNINDYDVIKNGLITMFPSGVIINVHVYTSDGKEIFVKNYNVSVTGNDNGTFTFTNNNPVRRNWNKEVPAQFLLYDSSQNYNATILLYYITGSDSQTIEVETDNQYNVNFYLPYTLLEMPCTAITDCVPDFCSDDGYYHKLTSCSDSQCQYIDSDCGSMSLCDTELGCFSYNTEYECGNDNDCLNNDNVTYCLNYQSMYAGACGSDGYCKKIEKQCTTFCNETVGYCNEKALCLLSETKKIGYEFSGNKNYVSVNCDFNNAGRNICVQMGSILKTDLVNNGVTINNVKFSDVGFGVKDIGDAFKISDLSVQCSDSCDLNIEFCSSGYCSIDTGLCLNDQTNNSYTSMIYGAWIWISGVIPIELRLFAWIIFTIFVMLYYSQQKNHSEGWRGAFSTSSNNDTMIVGLLMLIAGFGVGFIHWIFLLILGVVVSLVIANKIGQ